MPARTSRCSLSVACSLALLLAGGLSACGDDSADAPLAVAPARTAAQDTPPPAVAPGVLGSIADVEAAHRRAAYVNPAALSDLGGPLAAPDLARLVLGRSGAARLAAADDAPAAAVQLGAATVLTSSSGERSVVGAGAELRARLLEPEPQVSLITEETPSAVQSCLGDAAAEVIVGPAVLGRMAAVGAGVVANEDAPAGAKLVICVAPHLARDLHAAEDRLKARFPAGDAPAGAAPVVAEQEIGEREIVGASIPLASVDQQLLRELLAGGPALVELVRG